MNRILDNTEPKDVLGYFEEICAIPHGSGNMEAISNYVADFAKNHGLQYHQDQSYNVIIWKPASPGYEGRPVVMLQGHMDMVEAKEDWSDHDFASQGLELFTEGDELGARGTTLGGDDGIAVAYMLAVLADDTLPHPALECVFTVDEETGLLGAAALDLSQCRAEYLLNLDSEEEGIFLCSCAGGMRAELTLPVQRKTEQGNIYRIAVDGLIGGHSGMEIQKERANASLLMARILMELQWNVDLEWSLVSISGGEADNAIPRSSSAVIVSPAEESFVAAAIQAVSAPVLAEYKISDPGIRVQVQYQETGETEAMTPVSAGKVFFLLSQCPNGVQNMSQAIEGLAETSLNLGILSANEDEVKAVFAVRSSVETRKFALYDRLEFLIEFLGGSSTFYGDYPGWDYKVDSRLREQMMDIWNRMYADTPAKAEAIHAGVECGLILYQMPDLDIISMGPDMKNIHTPQERLNLTSVKRVYDYLKEVLRVLQ